MTPLSGQSLIAWAISLKLVPFGVIGGLPKTSSLESPNRLEFVFSISLISEAEFNPLVSN